jgi:cytochrome c oxidase subunit III
MATHAATATDLHHDEEHPPPIIWSAKTPVNLMGMFFFIGSEIALFGSFFISYFFLRIAGEADYSSWATQVGDILPMGIVTINSLILFSSSVTIHYAEIALARGSRGGMKLWLGLTILLGSVFLGIQIYEYYEFVVHDSLGPSTSAYSSVFFSLTGIHGSHVLVGLILLSIMLIRTFRRHYGPDPSQHVGFRTMAIYWHFVDVVWIFVFGLLYVPGNWSRWGEETVFGLPGNVTFFVGAAVIVFLLNLPRLIGKGAPRH